MDDTDNNIAYVAASLFLDGLSDLGLHTPNKIVVDYLPADIADLLFDALMEFCDMNVGVDVGRDDGDVVTLAAIEYDGAEVIPYRAGGRALDGRDPGNNLGSTGFASSLRDYFATDASRPRQLVTITSRGNETQKSAQDRPADQTLVTLRKLIHFLRDEQGCSSQAPAGQALDVLLDIEDEQVCWRDVFARCERYLAAINGQQPERQGELLPILGPFLPDPTPDFADGQRLDKALQPKEHSKRSMGASRLHDNAAIHGFLRESFEDPLRDDVGVVRQFFPDDDETTRRIAEAGLSGLKRLPLGTFASAEQKQRKSKIRLDLEDVEVVGAVGHQVMAGADGALLLIAASGPFSVTIGLSRGYEPQKERAAVVFVDGSERVARDLIDTEKGAQTVTAAFEAPQATSVHRVALLRGPNSITKPHDHVDVITVPTDRPAVVVEQSRQPDLGNQSWIAAGRPSFLLVHLDGERPESIDGEPIEDGPDDEAVVQEWRFTGLRQIVRVSEPVTDVDTDEKHVEDLLPFAVFVRGSGTAVRDALRNATVEQGHHLDAVKGLTESGEVWRVELAGNIQRKVNGAGSRVLEQAVGQLLGAPSAARLELEPDGALRPVGLEGYLSHDAEEALLGTRNACFARLCDLATNLLPRPREGVPLDVPLPLLPLHRARVEIRAWLDAWNTAVDEQVGSGSQPMTPALNTLLQLDTLRQLDTTGRVERVVLLPTHPWLLGSLLAFQDRLDAYFRSYKTRYNRLEKEIRSLVPTLVIEDWVVEADGNAHLRAEDSQPFYPSFVVPRLHRRRSTRDYMARIVANKIARYLQMHPHLNADRRSLRIGFVNPSDGRHLLEGIRTWLKNVQAQHVDRHRTLPMERIPSIEVFLFHSGGDDTTLGTAFDQFHQEQQSSSDEDFIRQAMVARVRYRKRPTGGPASTRDAVHLCFVHGLLRDQAARPRTGDLGEWWDGGFGDGLLATPLRLTMPGAGVGSLESRRGLWLDPASDGLRGALARLIGLQRGLRLGEVLAGKGVFLAWPLPDVSQLGGTYEHSDWVVHLDRELSLEMFQGNRSGGAPTIIEYSDQEVPDTPGYDTITVTRKDGPYREQLHEILSMAGLDVQNAHEAARASADRLLDDINLLSGSWALDFLLGSLADRRYSLRLQGNVGAALTWRWIHRFEHANGDKRVIDSNIGPVLPVFISLEELLRVTPAAGLPRRDGLAYRFSNEYEDESSEARQYCDDLLVLYITPSRRGHPSRLVGRVIEVKLGISAYSAKKKAVAQVRTTRKILNDHLGGDSSRVDAPFRDKQLSLLIKAQIEQAVAMGELKRHDLDRFNLPALSTNLATGNYSVEYTIGHEGRHLLGDVFLLSTSFEGQPLAIGVEEGVRVLRIGRDWVRWLAFNVEDADTLNGAEPRTLPRLGEYIHAVTQAPDLGDNSASAVTGAVTGEDPGPPLETRGEPRPSATPEPTTAPEIPDEPDAPAEPTPPAMALAEALEIPVKTAPYDDTVVGEVVDRLQSGLEAHGIDLESPLSIREVDRGPRLLRAYVRVAPSQPIAGVRRIAEDLARIVGTTAPDLNIINVTERRSIGIDLPVAGLEYTIDFDEIVSHPTFAASRAEQSLGFCAGIDVTGRSIWTDLAKMPHMLVAGTTGSGKTVFLRNVILTLLMQRSPDEFQLRLSSSKPMDFRIFTQVPHMGGTELARSPTEARQIIDGLIAEMERRMRVIDEAFCDDLGEYNEENPSARLPRIVCVLDEYAATVTSFDDKAERQAFETAVQRIAQEARAAGIHLILCMQRPDAKVITGNIKARPARTTVGQSIVTIGQVTNILSQRVECCRKSRRTSDGPIARLSQVVENVFICLAT